MSSHTQQAHAQQAQAQAEPIQQQQQDDDLFVPGIGEPMTCLSGSNPLQRLQYGLLLQQLWQI
jgi:hypothetical protein